LMKGTILLKLVENVFVHNQINASSEIFLLPLYKGLVINT